MEIASSTVLRLWQVFFSDPQASGFWRWFTRPGFRHVAAAAYYADQDRWVFVQPARHRLEVMVLRPEEATRFLGELIERATVVLQVEGREDRRFMPAMFGCVGALQALLGISGPCVAPYGLYRHLLANGAKVIASKEPARELSEAPAGRPGDCAAAQG
jgi:hypothetical protein